MPLHPQSQAFIDAMAAQNRAPWEEMGPAVSRDVFAGLTALFGGGPELHRVQDVDAGGVRTRLYRPTESVSPVLMYFHGGGWVLGDIETHDAVCRRLAKESGYAVVSVDYRRAPDSLYPAAFVDCFNATRFVASHSKQLGVNATQLVVAGDSAGGNLAAAVALKARDESGPGIAGQLLIYPAVDTNFERKSYVDFAEGFGLSRSTMTWFWRQYLNDQVLDEYAVPFLCGSLAGLPRTHVITAEYDVLRDEGEEFAQRLKAAHVPTTSFRYDGMLHGFVHFAEAFDVSRTAISDMAAFLREL